MPYICRRLLINQLPLPDSLDIAGKKPWEVAHFIDTLTLWKFGDYKNYTSLSLLAAAFGFPTPKDTINLFMKYKIMDLIPEERTTSATDFEAI